MPCGKGSCSSRRSRAGERNTYFWGTQAGAELDLVVFAGGRRIGVEVEYANAPTLTRSMRVARADLALDRLYVAYPGDVRYGLEDWAEAVPVAALQAELDVAARRGRRSRLPS